MHSRICDINIISMANYNTARGHSRGWLLSVLVVMFSFYLVWWILLNFTAIFDSGDYAADFADTYAVVALFGGLMGLSMSGKWGSYSSLLGKTILCLSLGLLAQVFGQFSYAFYARVSGVEVPYPSVGDLGFFGSIPFYVFGSYYLIKICVPSVRGGGFRFSVSPVSIVVPVAMLVMSYVILLRGYEPDWENIPGTFLDFGYPLFQAVYVSLAVIAFYYTKHMVDGIMHKKVVLLLIALVVQYCADFLFLYKAHRDLYVAAGITDLAYLVAYFFMSLSIINLDAAFEKARGGKAMEAGEAVS